MKRHLLLAAISSAAFGCATEPAAPSADASASKPYVPAYYRVGSHIPARDASVIGRDMVNDVDPRQAERELYNLSSNPYQQGNVFPRAQPGGN